MGQRACDSVYTTVISCFLGWAGHGVLHYQVVHDIIDSLFVAPTSQSNVDKNFIYSNIFFFKKNLGLDYWQTTRSYISHDFFLKKLSYIPKFGI